MAVSRRLDRSRHCQTRQLARRDGVDRVGGYQVTAIPLKAVTSVLSATWCARAVA